VSEANHGERHALRVRSRTFIALVASSSSAGITGGARLAQQGPPFRLVDGTLVAPDTDTLLNGTLKSAIARDEKNLPSGGTGVWTGMISGGFASGTDCQGWTAATQDLAGTYGTPALLASRGWMSGATVACDELRHLYCIEP
jgi:hypothetical protein